MNSITKTIIINSDLNPLDLPKQLVNASSKFSSTILLEKDERKVDLKSMLGVLSIILEKGQTVTLFIDGDDSEMAMTELEEILTK